MTMNNNEIATHDLTHSMDTPRCFLCTQRCDQGHPLQGHLTSIGGMTDQFRLYYAGWDDQWLVRTLDGEDMCRAGVEELPPFLIHEKVAS